MEDFRYEFKDVAGMPVVKAFQEEDKSGTAWSLKLLSAAFKGRRNIEEYVATVGREFQNPLPEKSPAEVVSLLAAMDFTKILAYYLPETGPMVDGGRPESIADYLVPYRTDPVPDDATRFVSADAEEQDLAFAEGYLAGLDPTVLHRVTAKAGEREACLSLEELLSKIPLTDAGLPGVFRGETLQDLTAARRLYYVDYSGMADLEDGVHPWKDTPKYIYAPLAVFALDGKNRLRPVAIQTGPDSSYALFTPADGYGWLIARTILQAATGSHHEMISHLAHTHLVLEAFAVCTKRNLDEGHAVRRLLDPHFDGTFPINYLAVNKLIRPGEAVDRLVGSAMDSNYSYISRHRLAFDFRQSLPPAQIAGRGVSPEEAAMAYPYRDDALLVWDALLQWTTAYTANHYGDDAAVAADDHLQAWLHDLATHGKIRGLTLADSGGISTRQELTEILAGVIFIAGPQHAAVNFSQITNGTFIPLANLAGYRPAPRKKQADYSLQDWLDFLPPLDVALMQQSRLTFLSRVRHTRLGHYGFGYFSGADRRAQLRFLRRLRRVERDLRSRNEQGTPYVHLLPSRIPQSTNI